MKLAGTVTQVELQTMNAATLMADPFEVIEVRLTTGQHRDTMVEHRFTLPATTKAKSTFRVGRAVEITIRAK